MPRIPGVPDLMALLRAQTEALLELPATVAALQRSVRALAEVVATGSETLLVVQRLALRVDRIVDELEAPVLALAPGLRRAAVALDDPIVGTIPDTVRVLQAEVMPLLRAMNETQARLQALPGASLLGSLTGRRVAADTAATVAGTTTAKPRRGNRPVRADQPAGEQ